MYQQKPFQVFINGMTGEVQGQRPYGAIKIAAAVIVAVILIVIVVILFQGSGGEPPQ